MSKWNGDFEEKSQKNKKINSSALSGNKSEDFQSEDRQIKNDETVRNDGKEKIIKKGSINSLTKSKISADSVYNVDDLSTEDLHDSLHRISKNPQEPFKFLSHILDNVDTQNHSPLCRSKPTDIDRQLASLVRRVEMNKSLLERTNQRVKDINFIVEKNKILASKELDYDKDSLSKMGDCDDKTEPNFEHPGIDAVQRTMKDTLQMLECIKKVASGDAVDELSSDFFSEIELRSISSNLAKTDSKRDTKSGP
ncbi:uncharacterized protein LOC117171419 isoform X2 [Belonocnema kinseyi]|uniref:uncharacterized protein LOC117171419 isoform X2 n=1 Tax=Belonocnema kinseyi TaxID=2817044 RepID=UPI00143D9820|nr:uncharacterized protein LOC117171419 isoform X2 [Belonocnema kinseyi]